MVRLTRTRTAVRAAATALLLALAAAAPGSLAAGSAGPPRVASLALRLPPGEDERALGGLVAIAPGDPLAPRALRRTVQRLFQTGRFRNVIVRATPVEGEGTPAVAVVVECLALRTVGAVRIAVEGDDRPLDDARLRAAADLDTGEPFDDADLERAKARLGEAFARKGYRDARVSATASGDAQVAVEIRIAPGAPTRVAALRLGDHAGPAAERAGTLRTRVGGILDEDALAEDVRALRDWLWRAGYRRARVSAPSVRVAAGSAEVDIAIEAGPVVSFAFRGNEAIPAAVLAGQLGIGEGEPLDVPAVDAAAERIRAHYEARGFAAVRVEVGERAAAGRVVVVFTIDEGRPYRIGRVSIEGAKARGEADVRARLLAALDAEAGEPPDPVEDDRARLLALSIPGERPPPAPPPARRARDFWEASAWDLAAQRVVDEYRADGWLEAAYLGGSVVLDARAGLADVTVRIREGPRRTVDSISFEGNEAVSLADLAREARLAPGAPLSFEKMEATRIALVRLYLSRGYAYVRVETRADPDPVRETVAVRYVISEGPEVRVGRILVSGNRRTRVDVVRRAVALSEGDVYRPEAVARSQAALLRLGVFRSVGMRLQEPESPDSTKDLAVEVLERPWQTIASGVGFSIANGPRAFVEYGRPNLLGRALEFTARAKVNYPLVRFRPDLENYSPHDRVEGRVELGLRQPRLEHVPFPLAVRADAVAERVHRKAYDLDRASGIAGVDFELASRATASLQYELEVDDIARKTVAGALSREDLERLRFGEGVTTLQSVRPSVALDFRDNAVNPRSGWFAAAAVEFTHSIGEAKARVLGILPGSEIYTNMLKLSTTLSGYLPIGPASVIALSARAGRVVPLDDLSTTPVPKRFFLGGASTMRGYAEDEMIPEDLRASLREEARLCATSLTGIGCTSAGRALVAGDIPVSQGAQAYLLLKSELRVRIRGSLEAGFFADVGNLWFDPASYRLLDLRLNLGVGIRFVTPIGPAVLDFGFNANRDPMLNERVWAPHFAIGLF
jgi:outer membrane protein insertion porin family